MSKLDPRTKIVILVCISCAAMFTTNLWFLLGLFGFTVCLLFIGRVGLSRQKKQFTGALSMIVFLFILQAIFGQAYFGAVLCVRLMIVIMSALILLTGHMRDYLLALVQMKMPYELAYMVVLAFHFFPILRQEALDVYHSMQLRGTELKHTSIKNKLGAYKRMCIPIMAGALSRAQDTAVAMEARGFRMHKQRTYMRKLTLKKKDKFLMILFPVLAVCFLLGACTTPSKDALPEKQVAISILDENSVSISWTDEVKYDGIVKCGKVEYEATCTQIYSEDIYRYRAVISDLEDGKSYTYSVGNGKDMSPETSFCIDDTQEEFSFLYIGDIQYQIRDRDYEIWGDYFEEAYKKNDDVSFALFAGDMVEKNADPDDWAAFFTNAEPVLSKIPIMSTIGNHETSITPELYLKMMAVPENGAITEEVYSFDYGDCHFVSLNSCLFLNERKGEDGYAEDVEAVSQWLSDDLSNNDKKWTIIYMHHPMYPVVEDMTLYSELRENWEEILANNDVDLVLCGHQHIYMRTSEINGITHVMANSGEKHTYYLEEGVELPEFIEIYEEQGSNYVRVDVSDEKLTLVTYGEEHQEIDRCEIN